MYHKNKTNCKHDLQYIFVYIYNLLGDSHLLLISPIFLLHIISFTPSDFFVVFFCPVPSSEVKEKGLDLEESMAAKWMYLGPRDPRWGVWWSHKVQGERKCLEGSHQKSSNPVGLGLYLVDFLFKLKGGWGVLIEIKELNLPTVSGWCGGMRLVLEVLNSVMFFLVPMELVISC